jgi:transcription-repair coupling factor (superfamily II helicase)
MSMMGVRDLSIIETPPEDRLAIETHLLPFDEATIVRGIEFELERGGQVFFVHNRVQTIKFMAESLRQMVPGARFDIAHGQMKEKELEDTMVRFLRREIDVLVCTTIIESGLDIPSANTIIINEVERFGLAQIYQLRGRVGRANEKAYAYLLLSDPLGMTRDAEKRLKALMDFTHLGAGIHIALHDLRIRGGGNILGFVQSGHISSIGYELYLRMIEQAVAELKGEEWKEDINPEIHVDVPAFLPGEYVADTDIRLNLYRRLSSLREEPQLGVLSEEIRDRFGPPSQEVENLLDLVSVRMLLKRMDISRLDVGKSGFTLTFSPQNGCDPDALVRLVTRQPRRFHFLPHNRLRVNTGPVSLPQDLRQIKRSIESLDIWRT